jgi:hypothetical protein
MNPAPKPEYRKEPRLLDWISCQPCLACDRLDERRPVGHIFVTYTNLRLSDPHHVDTKGMGGGAYDDVDNVVPLCRAHHTEGDTIGWPTWERKYRLNLKLEARKYTLAWHEAERELSTLPFREDSDHAR